MENKSPESNVLVKQRSIQWFFISFLQCNFKSFNEWVKCSLICSFSASFERQKLYVASWIQFQMNIKPKISNRHVLALSICLPVLKNLVKSEFVFSQIYVFTSLWLYDPTPKFTSFPREQFYAFTTVRPRLHFFRLSPRPHLRLHDFTIPPAIFSTFPETIFFDFPEPILRLFEFPTLRTRS